MVDHIRPEAATNALIPSVSVEQLVARRDHIAALYSRAHAALQEAHDLADGLLAEYRYTPPELYDRVACASFTDPAGLPKFLRRLDAHVWNCLLSESGVRTHMDAEARARWDESIRNCDVPELTPANVTATFTDLLSRRGEMFEDGVVAAFRRLSWDYKTNNPRLFGKRIVVTHVVDVWGNGYVTGVSFSGSNTLDDLVRVMLVCDGKPEPDHRRAAYHTLREAEWPKRNKDVQLSGVVSVRGFKNGNAHVTFLRPDLVEKLNRIVARRCPNALPPATEST